MKENASPARMPAWLRIFAAMALYLVWTLATWAFEGRRLTLVRGDEHDRLHYALFANIALGIALGVVVLRFIARRGGPTPAAAGFRGLGHAALAVLAGIALGAGFLLIQRPPTLHPAVLLNAFCQVLVVSMAEVVVCWAVLATTLAHGVSLPKPAALALAVLVAAVLFGIYHFAHSPPFNTVAMVRALTIVGLVTGMFFFVARDVYGTIAFHNTLALYGVMNALAESGRLGSFTRVQPMLVTTALAAVALLVLLDRFVLRRRTSPVAPG